MGLPWNCRLVPRLFDTSKTRDGCTRVRLHYEKWYEINCLRHVLSKRDVLIEQHDSCWVLDLQPPRRHQSEKAPWMTIDDGWWCVTMLGHSSLSPVIASTYYLVAVYLRFISQEIMSVMDGPMDLLWFHPTQHLPTMSTVTYFLFCRAFGNRGAADSKPTPLLNRKYFSADVLQPLSFVSTIRHFWTNHFVKWHNLLK